MPNSNENQVDKSALKQKIAAILDAPCDYPIGDTCLNYICGKYPYDGEYNQAIAKYFTSDREKLESSPTKMDSLLLALINCEDEILMYFSENKGAPKNVAETLIELCQAFPALLANLHDEGIPIKKDDFYPPLFALNLLLKKNADRAEELQNSSLSA